MATVKLFVGDVCIASAEVCSPLTSLRVDRPGAARVEVWKDGKLYGGWPVPRPVVPGDVIEVPELVVPSA